MCFINKLKRCQKPWHWRMIRMGYAIPSILRIVSQLHNSSCKFSLTNYTVDSPQGFQLLDLHHILYMDVYTSILYKSLYPHFFPLDPSIIIFWYILWLCAVMSHPRPLTHVCMYVCVYVCMHVWMYVCMRAYMYGCMYVCMHAWVYGCMDVCMYRRIDR